jgi:tRNA pseudouridine38-40 synthase
MPRYRLTIEYDGRPYNGFQAQASQPSVQGAIEAGGVGGTRPANPNAVVVSGDWHARFSANERRYLYRILNRRAPPALEAGKVWHVKKPIDAEAMHVAAQHLVGLHDFTTFRDMACQAKSPLKTLDVARVSRVGDEVHLVFEARSFLHRQVRSMTGTLAEVGVGRWTANDVKAALDARNRTACGPVAPSDGLYLTGVGYEAEA